MSLLPKQVKIVEVSPRDGLQNEKKIIDLNTKLALINKLADAGLQNIEVTGFVSPKWVPQLADAIQLCQQLTPQQNLNYSALVPNLKGMESALSVNIKEVAVFTAASESFTKKNINCSIDESLTRFKQLLHWLIKTT